MRKMEVSVSFYLFFSYYLFIVNKPIGFPSAYSFLTSMANFYVKKLSFSTPMLKNSQKMIQMWAIETRHHNMVMGSLVFSEVF